MHQTHQPVVISDLIENTSELSVLGKTFPIGTIFTVCAIEQQGYLLVRKEFRFWLENSEQDAHAARIPKGFKRMIRMPVHEKLRGRESHDRIPAVTNRLAAWARKMFGPRFL